MISQPVSTTTLLVVRHAQTIWNHARRYAGHREVPLSPDAADQIRRLTKRLEQESIQAIYSSPLTRAQLTVRPIAEILNLPLHIEDELKERDLGSWEGKSAEELIAHYPQFRFPESAYDGEFVVPEAETLEELEKRARVICGRLAEEHAGQTILISTHAGIIWALERKIAQNSKQGTRWPENSSLVRLTYQENIFTLS